MEFLPLFREKPLSTDTLTNLFTVFDGEFYANLIKELDKTLVVKEILYEIVTGLRKYYGFRGKNPVNFEQIMHLVDLYCSICAEKFRLVAYSRSPAELIDLNLPFIELFNGIAPASHVRSIDQLPIFMRNYILDNGVHFIVTIKEKALNYSASMGSTEKQWRLS